MRKLLLIFLVPLLFVACGLFDNDDADPFDSSEYWMSPTYVGYNLSLPYQPDQVQLDSLIGGKVEYAYQLAHDFNDDTRGTYLYRYTFFDVMTIRFNDTAATEIGLYNLEPGDTVSYLPDDVVEILDLVDVVSSRYVSERKVIIELGRIYNTTNIGWMIARVSSAEWSGPIRAIGDGGGGHDPEKIHLEEWEGNKFVFRFVGGDEDPPFFPDDYIIQVQGDEVTLLESSE